MTSLDHPSLGCSLRGVHDSAYGVVHFRGIRYGKIPTRFAVARHPEQLSEVVDCTEHGPRCPQTAVDVGYLLRLPSQLVLPREVESEFECLNLDICSPESCCLSTPSKQHERLPVLVWIHGGSQSISFGSTSSKVCDMTRIVSESATMRKPFIAVSIQYRVNIFSHGSSPDQQNLALSDQALAIDWVVAHIAGFGGDPTNITLAGESAGAVYCHAHIVVGSPVRQCILLSGSLFLSPPQPSSTIAALRQRVASELQKLDNSRTLNNAPVDELVQALEMTGIQSWFLVDCDALKGWRNTMLNQRLLVSDVQHESVIWKNGIWSSSAESIVAAFNVVEPERARAQLMEKYGIRSDRPSSCKLGALEFINDYKFVLPAERLVRNLRMTGIPANDDAKGTAFAGSSAFRCIIDELNPWQPSHGAHHAIDLLLLFGRLDLSMGPGAEKSGQHMRTKFIEFINGSDPWETANIAAFGPYGLYQVLDNAEFGTRRRTPHLEVLKDIDASMLDQAFLNLASGKISLLN